MGTFSVENPQVGGVSSLSITGIFAHNWTAFADQDATPSVSGGYAFLTANTVLTTITDFDDPDADGQTIKVKIKDVFTRIAHNANIKLQNAGGIDGYYGTGAVNDMLVFTYEDGVWTEETRSPNS